MNLNNKITYSLITGGLGFIGSHCCNLLLENDKNIIIIDNLSNSNIDVLEKIKKINTKKHLDILFFNYDIKEEKAMNSLFLKYKIDNVIHLAGLKAVAESIKKPLSYYENNINGTLNLLKIMEKHNCKKLIFSSSATVYGDQKYPVDETNETGKNITNPYGKTKYVIEEILKDLYNSDKTWSIIILRYFNPVGAHTSGLLGENPKDIPNNLFPFILKTAIGEYDILRIFGSDYNTKDGTCIRDFIHVEDLALGHVRALEYFENNSNLFEIFNLGTGKGYSVKEMVDTFERVNELIINKEFVERRDGDLPIVVANVDKANKILKWKAEKTLEDICKDGYKFIKK